MSKPERTPFTRASFGDHRDDLTAEQYRAVAFGFDHILHRCAALLDEGQVERARAALLINPWPLDPAALEGLKAMPTDG